MSIKTAIEWADSTANYWEGCTQISPGCDGCYAMTRAARYGSVEWNGPPRRVAAGAQVARAAQRIAEKTGVKQVVFVNSLSDFFDNQAPAQWRLEALDVMRDAPDCVFLILTKRVGNVERMMRDTGIDWARNLPNAWLGISVVNQAEADRDIPKALEAKAALAIPRLFLSVEPMLGQMHVARYFGSSGGAIVIGGEVHEIEPRDGVDWVICGGESGKDARPMHPDWARALRDQCAAAGVPFMFKQWGEWGVDRPALFGGLSPREKNNRSRAFFPDGRAYNPREPDGYTDPTLASMYLLGKKAAGRLLDGVEHNGRPQL